MNLAAFAIKYRPIVLTFSALLMLWGVYSYFTMPRREDPEYTVRTCAVTTVWPGAPAEKVEQLITDPIEEAIDSIDEVDIVYSTSSTGQSTVYVDAEESVSAEKIDNVWDKVRARMKRVKMPAAGIQPDVNDEYGDTFVLLLSVYQKPLPGHDKIERPYSLRELDIISKAIKDKLRLLPGVAKAEQYGVTEEAIYIEADMGTWSQLSLTIDRLGNLAESRNIVASGGTIDTTAGQFTVKPGGELNAVDELESIIVGATGKGEATRPVYLKDLDVDIRRGYQDPPTYFCRFRDADTTAPSVVVAISMKSGANIVTICEAAKARVKELQEIEKIIPPDIGIGLVSDQSENVSGKINDVVSNVIGAILIVVVIVYLFVGMRTAIVMAANIPVVVLSAIALITIFGVQLEQISLASIIIALGLLVDNAVQVCDQSRVNQIAGMNPTEATVRGASMLASPMLMGTATTVAAFAPMLFGLVGSKQEYIYSLPVTLSVTLGISWVLAMTLCTILAAWIIRAPADPNAPSGPLALLMSKLQRKSPGKSDNGGIIDSVFRGVVRKAIDLKFVTVGISFALFGLCILLPLYGFVGSEFFPKDLRDQFVVEVFLPETATISQTNKAAKRVEEIVQRLSPGTDSSGQPVEKLRAMRTMVGGGGARWYLSWGPESRKPNYAEILVRTTDPHFTPQLAIEVRRIAEQGDEALGLKPISGVRVVPQELYLGPSEDPVEIRIIGSGFANMDVLRYWADRVKDLVRNDKRTWDVNDSWGISGFQLRVDIDEDRANLAGVTNSQIAKTLNAYYSGQRLTTFREGDHLVPVYLRLKPEDRESLKGLENAFVEGHKGKVPLNSVATLNASWEPARIERRDLNRVIEVRSQVEPGVRGNDVVKEIMSSYAMKQIEAELPSGYRIEVGGALAESQEGASQLGACLGISLLTIVLLLVVQYNGWVKPTIILTTLPLALIGALPGLFLTGNPLGFMPQLGILSLFGIVLNTGIIFIEFADMLIADAARKSDGSGPIVGLTSDQFRNCLVDSCKQRLMPIFLTTATTIGGLLPLALAGGPLWEGMAWAMIFGLIVATMLTLLVIPALYAIFVEAFGVAPVEVAEEST
ncbi:MAG: multidrug efflux pump subunit AcrB [Pirellulaceae bacterium]|jgi:multidrug efflux pump subunit AcrB